MSVKQQPSPRLDKWLWAARFFKTRGLAQAAIEGGKVHYGSSQSSQKRVKPSQKVQVGAFVTITKGELVWEVEILDLTARRGPASEAQLLYRETEESIAKQQQRTEVKRLQRESGIQHANARPNKKQRRQLRDFKEHWSE